MSTSARPPAGIRAGLGCSARADMTVRLKLALTVFATGLLTALLVIAAVIYAFQRFEHETAYRRGSAFLQRVAANYDDLFELYERRPEEFQGWLHNMVLFEPVNTKPLNLSSMHVNFGLGLEF